MFSLRLKTRITALLAAAFEGLVKQFAPHKRTLQAEKDFELSLLQHSSLPTFVLDARHRLLHWNRACEIMTGMGGDGLVGTSGHGRAFFGHDRPTLADLVIDGGSEISAYYPCCQKTGDGYHAEGWYRQLNGRDRYLSFYAAPIQDAGGALVAVIETIEDITDRKKSEEEVRRTVSLLNATLESTADGIVVRGLDGRITAYNRKFVEMWNLPSSLLETNDDKLLRMFAKEQLKDPEKFLATTELLYEKPELESRDIVEFKDGRVFERVSQPQRVDNTVVGRVVNFRDITEREEVKAALCNSISRYRSLVDNIDLGITLVDTDHRIVMTNAAAAGMFNRKPIEVVQRYCFREFKNREEVCDHCPGGEAMQSGHPVTVHTEGARADGSPFSMKIRAFPVSGADGTPTGFIEVIQDITEQQQAEADKKLLEAQLRQSQKMEALGTLAGGIAHDFNNILTAIFAYCSLIDRKLEPESAVRSYLAKLIASSERASTLTQRLLTYCRKQPLAPQAVEIDEVVDKVTLLLSRLLGEDVELAIEPAGEPLTVMADPSQLGQVLMNLATNARDAMPEGGRLTIVTRRFEPDQEFQRTHGLGKAGSYAALTVSDNGLGIEEPLLERIFEPFFTTKEVGKGTGLGLSVAYGIIKQHNGQIAVTSQPGRGTSFTIYLPLSSSRETETAGQELPAARPGHETILLVEDDAEIRTTLKELLEQDGYTVIEAVNGEDGVGKYQRHGSSIDLLLLDVIMPKKSGSAVYQEISRMNPGIKVIFMSGYTADLLDAKGVASEQYNFLFKPLAVDHLLAKIREVLDTPQPVSTRGPGG
ncbi:MAG TPA: PAS domain S-box protein [Geomonas sp.]|nr:PAS domain S-box protein [Geomonas sp.]